MLSLCKAQWPYWLHCKLESGYFSKVWPYPSVSESQGGCWKADRGICSLPTDWKSVIILPTKFEHQALKPFSVPFSGTAFVIQGSQHLYPQGSMWFHSQSNTKNVTTNKPKRQNTKGYRFLMRVDRAGDWLKRKGNFTCTWKKSNCDVHAHFEFIYTVLQPLIPNPGV